MTELAFRSATQLAAMVRKGKIGCLELLDYFLERVERYDRKINAIVVRDFDRARDRARTLDSASNIDGPLVGVPMTVKESFDIIGLPTTWGIPEHRNSRASSNALAVDRFLAAGATVFGKTNVPRFLGESQSHNVIYGVTNNPWDLSRTPGGSSGGAAAALAAGLTGLEIGSDIGNSIRNPAHFCGVYGHKPTQGICPPLGHTVAGNVADLDMLVIGPLARSAEDLIVALNVIAGPEEIDLGWKLTLPPSRFSTIKDLRVAILSETPEVPVDREIVSKLNDVAAFLKREGAEVSFSARPEIDLADAHGLYIRMLRATTASARATSDAELAHWRNEALSRSIDDGSYYAQMARGISMTHRDWSTGNEIRHRLRRRWFEFFKEWDVLLCPVTGTVAYPHDHTGEVWEREVAINGVRVPIMDQMFWAGISNFCYLPATAVPIGFTKAGLPIGMQIVGPQYGDMTTLHLAKFLEHAWQRFVVPNGWTAS
jgi:amidase